MILAGAVVGLLSLFKKDEPMISEEGKKLLSNDKHKRMLLDALKNNESSIEIDGQVIQLK